MKKTAKFEYLVDKNKSGDYKYKRQKIEMFEFIGSKEIYVNIGKNKKDYDIVHRNVEMAILIMEDPNKTKDEKISQILELLPKYKNKMLKKNENTKVETIENDKSIIPQIMVHIKNWENVKSVTGKANNTKESYGRVIKDFKNFLMGKEINSYEEINEGFFLDFLLYKENNSKSFKNSSKKYYITILKNLFTYIDGESNKETMKAFKNIKIVAEERKAKGLTKDEQEKILRYMNVNIEYESDYQKKVINRDRLMFKVLFYAGLRESGLISLKLSDFVYDNTRDRYFLHVIEKKNKERTMWFKKESIQKELEYLLSIGQEYLCETKPGKVMGRKGVWNVITNMMKNSEVNKTGVHIIRHTFARNLVSNNISLSTIKELMGHENIETTMIYAKTNEKNMIDALDTL